MLKKSFSFIIILSLLLTACTNGNNSSTKSSTSSSTTKSDNFNKTGYPVVKDKVTLRILTASGPSSPADFNNLEIIKKIEGVTNVHIDWIMAGASYQEKRSLMLAAGDLPDILTKDVTASELVRYGKEGVFIPMQNLIKEYAPNVKTLMQGMPGLEKFVTAPDGNIYGTPRVNAAPWTAMNGMGVINKAWLKKLGLSMPTTTDEFYNVLKAFKTGDPNGNGKADEVPMTFAVGIGDLMGFSYLMGSFGVPIAPNFTDVKDGKVRLIATLPEYKEAISYIAKLYKEGLVNNDGFTLNRQQLDAKISQQPFVTGYTQIWDIPDDFSVPSAKEDYDFMPLLKGPNGRTPVFYEVPFYGVSRGNAVITKACKTPEVAMRWIDYLYDTNISMQVAEGPIGTRIIKQTDGSYEIAPAPQGKTGTQWKDENAMGGYGFWAITSNTYKNILKLPATSRKVEFMDKNTSPFADKESSPPVYYSQSESQVVSQVQLDIVKFVERKSSEWIMNGKINDEWDSFINEINKMGLKQWLETNQTAYDRFIK